MWNVTISQRFQKTRIHLSSCQQDVHLACRIPYQSFLIVGNLIEEDLPPPREEGMVIKLSCFAKGGGAERHTEPPWEGHVNRGVGINQNLELAPLENGNPVKL